jgi:GTP-binding protein LepA
LYPVDNDDYNDLRDNLDKLKLNDNSFIFEPESSPALGFGFKCGFLGVLHLEIIKERIERDYEIPLLVTMPSVKYKLYLTDGEKIDLISPVDYPNPSKIKEIHEPFVKVNIIVKADFLGNVLKLCEEYRGEYNKMEYLDTQKVILNYRLPLAEILVDFYDKLKSCTKGYASFDYEMAGYAKSDLIKVDILINKEPVDALSMIMHKDKSYNKGKAVVDKLKDLIPRQQFAIPIQAAIGSKVISRSTIKALRKDVLAKLYGGDITRKQKVLKKQKLGKKKLKTIGKVSVPNEVFSSILKI